MYLSTRDDGLPLGNQTFLCTCHHATRVDVVEQKVLADLSSFDDGVRLGNEKFLCTCHHVMRVDVVEQKNSCGPVIM